ncbi:facilitated trehalose transporter Tret1-like [Galleria mellonella]|uniref:Facilitated trehalose transporter Tret1-like n=1 Tax=Galleria mellonella TaxID=7137 RepID=A0ABM3MIK5_GALME|nr:facilitated trehalose transporter Tret1-like [Galleria mellonella]
MVSYILREWLVMTPLILHHLAIGFVLGFPAILTPAITNNSADIHATRNDASWITAAYGMTGCISFLTVPPLMQMYGRKFANILLNTAVLCGFIIIALASNVVTLITGRAIQGIAFGGLYISSILASEYSHLKRRGFFVIFKVTASCVGVLVCHGFGFIISWRNMAWLSTVPPILAILVTTTLPESPLWLAYKGRFEECVMTFEWIRGKDQQAKKELKELLTAQYELQACKNNKDSLALQIKKAITSKNFLKPFLIVTELLMLSQMCGRYYLIAYVVQIMTQLTGHESKAFYCIITVDVLKILAVLLSSYIVRLFNRRLLIFSTGLLSCFLLTVVCIIQYLNWKFSISLGWSAPILLVLYDFICNVGVIPLSILLKGEMFPLQYKGIGTCASGLINAFISMATLKLTSSMLDIFQIHGTFGVYSSIAVLLLTHLYFILPETKDRTLQDIENEFVDVKISINAEEVTNKLLK